LFVGALEADVGDEVDEALHLDRLDAAAGVVAGELVLEVRVVELSPSDGEDGVVDQRGDIGTGRMVLQVLPAGFGRDPEDALGGVLIAAFEQAFEVLPLDAVLFQLFPELDAAGLERNRDVLQEQQPEHNLLVFRRINGAPELIGGLPKHIGVVEIGGVSGEFGTRVYLLPITMLSACLRRIITVGIGHCYALLAPLVADPAPAAHPNYRSAHS